jgi:RNA polymerase sigma-70 factor (ECF subfamily)
VPASPADVAAPDQAPPADVALVARVGVSGRDALGTLYDRHGAASWALARAIVREDGDAEDVVAQVFAQLWRTAARYDAARGSVGAWLMMATRTRALDLLRARRRQARVVERAAAEDDTGFALPVGGSAEGPDADVERGEVARAVRASLAALPAPQREAIELAFFGGLSHGDVARALGQPLGTVKTRIRDGMRKLRGVLAPLWSGPVQS